MLLCPPRRCFTLVRFTRGSLDISTPSAYRRREGRFSADCIQLLQREWAGGKKAKPGTAGNLGLAGVKVGIAKLQWMWGRQTASFLFFSLLLIKLTLSSQCPTYCNRILMTTLCPANLPISFFFPRLFFSFFSSALSRRVTCVARRPPLVLVFYVSLHL